MSTGREQALTQTLGLCQSALDSVDAKSALAPGLGAGCGSEPTFGSLARQREPGVVEELSAGRLLHLAAPGGTAPASRWTAR